MQQPVKDEGLSSDPALNHSHTEVHEVSSTMEDDRSRDRLEAESVKYNVARIVRLSSGRFALFSHYRAGALDLITVGTIEEIVDHIPSADECAYTAERPAKSTAGKIKSIDLADLGL